MRNVWCGEWGMEKWVLGNGDRRMGIRDGGNTNRGMEMGKLDRKMRMGDGDGGMGMEKGMEEMRMIGKC